MLNLSAFANLLCLMASPPKSSTRCCTRRKLIGWGGGSVLAALGGYLGWPRHANDRPATGVHPAEPTVALAPHDATGESAVAPVVGAIGREAFLPHLHSKFQLASPDGPHAVCQLVEVSASKPLVSPGARFTSFSLLFSAASDFVAESRIYHLTHEQLDAMDLFLSPVGKSDKQVCLEAVFSQRI